MKTRSIAFIHQDSSKKALITVYEIPESLFKKFKKIYITNYIHGRGPIKPLKELQTKIKAEYKGITFSYYRSTFHQLS